MGDSVTYGHVAGTPNRGGGAGGLEYISLDGLRLDGRRPSEVRKIRCGLGTLARADGSAYYEQGSSRVLAAVYGLREPAIRANVEHDRAIVKCQYSTAVFASTTYRRTWKVDRRSTAAATIVRNALEGDVLVTRYPGSQTDMYVQVLQDDGGALVAATNAASLALFNAGVAMSDFVAACGAGLVDEMFVVDPNAVKSGGERPEILLGLLCDADTNVNYQVNKKPPNAAAFEEAVEIARARCEQIFQVLKYKMRKYSLGLLDFRGLVAL